MFYNKRSESSGLQAQYVYLCVIVNTCCLQGILRTNQFVDLNFWILQRDEILDLTQGF